MSTKCLSPNFGGLEPSAKCEQFTYGVVSEGVFAESLLKFCGNFAKQIHVILSGKGAEILRKACGTFAEICGHDPFPNNPVSELLTRREGQNVKNVLKIVL